MSHRERSGRHLSAALQWVTLAGARLSAGLASRRRPRKNRNYLSAAARLDLLRPHSFHWLDPCQECRRSPTCKVLHSCSNAACASSPLILFLKTPPNAMLREIHNFLMNRTFVAIIRLLRCCLQDEFSHYLPGGSCINDRTISPLSVISSQAHCMLRSSHFLSKRLNVCR